VSASVCCNHGLIHMCLHVHIYGHPVHRIWAATADTGTSGTYSEKYSPKFIDIVKALGF